MASETLRCLASCTITSQKAAYGNSFHCKEGNQDCFLQVVSQAVATGKVQVVPSLAEIQGKDFAENVVIITDSVGGNEDIPVGSRLPEMHSLCFDRIHTWHEREHKSSNCHRHWLCGRQHQIVALEVMPSI